MNEKMLPERPEKPLPSDCCNSGCTPCILDVYEDQVKQWEETCKLLQSGSLEGQIERTQSTSILFPTKYSTFKIVSTKALTSDTYLYRFQAVEKVQEDDQEPVYRDLKCTLNYQPSQYFILQGSEFLDGSEKSFTRAYTPISSKALSLSGCFDVVIKLYPNGKMSQYIQKLKTGDVTSWRGPYGGFNYKPNSYKRILMFCAGTGIAPLYSISQLIVSNDDDETLIRLLFCSRDESSIIFRNEIQTLRLFWNFSAVIYLSHCGDTSCKPLYGETLKTVRLDKDAVASELSNARNFDSTMVLICGSPQFCSDIEQYVKDCNVDPNHVFIF